MLTTDPASDDGSVQGLVEVRIPRGLENELENLVLNLRREQEESHDAERCVANLRCWRVG